VVKYQITNLVAMVPQMFVVGFRPSGPLVELAGDCLVANTIEFSKPQMLKIGDQSWMFLLARFDSAGFDEVHHPVLGEYPNKSVAGGSPS
jgi:hypothetical protein